MKFSAENAAFTKLWDSVEGPTIIKMVLNDPDLLYVKPHYFSTAFRIGRYVPTDETGLASFTVTSEQPTHSTVMDLRQPLGEGKPLEEGETFGYSGSIRGFIAPTYNETATARWQKEKLMEKYGSDAAILKGFATNELAPRIDSGYQTLDYLALRAETTFKCRYDVGRGGSSNIYAIPAEYRQYVNAGPKVWTDPDADILTSVMNIIEAKWLEWGIEIPMKIKMPEDYFRSVWMKNKNIIETLKMNWLTAQGQLVAGTDTVSNWVITPENFNRYVAASIPNFPRIELVKSKQMDKGVLIDPWESGIIILCADNTYAGEILRTDSQDEEIYSRFANSACQFAFARTADDLMVVMNSVLPNGNLKEYHTKVWMDAIPALTDFMHRVLIRSNIADA